MLCQWISDDYRLVYIEKKKIFANPFEDCTQCITVQFLEYRYKRMHVLNPFASNIYFVIFNMSLLESMHELKFNN